MSDKYILGVHGQPVKAESLLEWAGWFEGHIEEKQLRNTVIGGVRISTVFLGLDHSFGEGKPVLWETMIFGGDHDGYMQRYVERRDAIAGHVTAVRMVEND